jgi:hypothetical protein
MDADDRLRKKRDSEVIFYFWTRIASPPTFGFELTFQCIS